MIEKAMDVLAKYDTKEHAAIKKLATSYPQLRILVTALKEPFANAKMFLTPGFENFSYVKKGEVLAFDGDKKIKAPFSGFMLFPKYPKRDDSGNATGPLPTDIFNLAREATSKDLQ
jgi:succinylglutamate desuccinylase